MNTTGVTGDSIYDQIISIRDVSELTSIDTSNSNCLLVGAAVSITDLMAQMEAMKNTSGYEYFTEILDLWNKVGSVHLRAFKFKTFFNHRESIVSETIIKSFILEYFRKFELQIFQPLLKYQLRHNHKILHFGAFQSIQIQKILQPW